MKNLLLILHKDLHTLYQVDIWEEKAKLNIYCTTKTSVTDKIYTPASFKTSRTTEFVSLLSRLDPAALG